MLCHITCLSHLVSINWHPTQQTMLLILLLLDESEQRVRTAGGLVWLLSYTVPLARQRKSNNNFWRTLFHSNWRSLDWRLSNNNKNVIGLPKIFSYVKLSTKFLNADLNDNLYVGFEGHTFNLIICRSCWRGKVTCQITYSHCLKSVPVENLLSITGLINNVRKSSMQKGRL